MTYGVNSLSPLSMGQPSVPVIDAGTQTQTLAQNTGEQIPLAQPPEEQGMFSKIMGIFGDGNQERGAQFLGNQMANIGNTMARPDAVNAILRTYGKPSLPANQQQNMVNQLGRANFAGKVQDDRAAVLEAMRKRFEAPSYNRQRAFDSLMDAVGLFNTAVR